MKHGSTMLNSFLTALFILGTALWDIWSIEYYCASNQFKTVDIGTTLLASVQRISAIDFRVPIMPNNDAIIAFLCPFPEVTANGNSITGIFKPFQLEVWIGIGVSLIIYAHWFFDLSFLKFNQEIFQNSSAHDGLSAKFNLPGKIVAVVWCLMAVVLVNAFSGCVMSLFIMTPVLVPMVDSIDDIAALVPRPILMVSKFTATEAQLIDRTTGNGNKIGATLQEHPENRLQQTTNIFDEIPEKVNSDGGHCYAETESTLNLFMEYDFKKTGIYDYTLPAIS